MAVADNYNRWLLDRSRPFLGKRILDVGAGLGTHTARLAERAELVVAVEPDPDHAAELERRFAGVPHVRVVRAEAGELDETVAGGVFDTIVCFNVLEHVADDEDALRRFRRLLVPGGRAALLVPAHPTLYGSIDSTVAHQRRYTKRDLASKLARAGFASERMQYVNPLGALGWLVAARIARTPDVPSGPLTLYDRLVPLLRPLDHLSLPFGLSLWAIGRGHATPEHERRGDGEHREGVEVVEAHR
jgi:SAM-dependent methyltransferase